MVNKSCNCFIKEGKKKQQTQTNQPTLFSCLGALSLRDFTSNSPVSVKVVVKKQKNGVFSLRLHDLSNVLIEV